MSADAVDLSGLGPISMRLADAIFQEFPEFRAHAKTVQMADAERLSLDLIVPSPTGDPERGIWVWVDEIGMPAIGFGTSHTSSSPDPSGISEILDLLRAIVRGQLMILEDVGGEYPGHRDWLDLRDSASPASVEFGEKSGKWKLLSWSGELDRG